MTTEKKDIDAIRAENEIRINEERARDKSRDYELMKLPTPEELEHCETIAEFLERPPSFCVGEVYVDAEIQTTDGKFGYKRGTNLCLTPYSYRQLASGERPCIRPAKMAFRDIYKRYQGQDLAGKTLMAWRGGGIGDLLFIRPILVHLKKTYPTAKIIFATKRQYHDMLIYWDDAIDALCDISFDVEETLMKSDYHMTFEGVIERVKESETRDAHDTFAQVAGLNPDDIDWCVPMATKADNPFFAGVTDKYVVVQPRSSAEIRTPFAGTFVKAINAATARGYRVVLADTPMAMRRTEDLRTSCADPSKVINFAKISTKLHDTVELVNRAACVVAPDSAFTHIAAMQGVPSIALYGPFPGSCRTARYPLCVTIETLPSNVCKFGGRECFLHAPWGKCANNTECWATLDDDLVVKTLNEMLDALEG